MVYFLDWFCRWNCLINAKVSIFFQVKCVSDGLFISKLYQNKLRKVTFSIAYIFCCTKLKLHSALYLKIRHNVGNSNYGVIDNNKHQRFQHGRSSVHWCCEFESRSKRGVQHYIIKFVRLATGRWFSPSPPVSFTNKTDRHDITEILLKVALNTIKQ